ncbi:MAG: class I tRNA ligase family protein, partial [Novosphingobium sp.]|nr:class I tRNA ligase family protein [Novosphingobium sp.]
VATTRPETMLADMAVAVHPDDERYTSVIGKEILQPITGRRFAIVADEHADPELGSGAVKITPGHDFNDFDVGRRSGIAAGDMLNMFDAEAQVVQTSDGLVPEKYVGVDRFVARDMVVAEMKDLGRLIPHISKNKQGEEVELDAEPRTIATPFGDRGGVVVEPWLTDQWYVNAEELAKAPMQAVRDGSIEIVPKSWEKTFFNWMENIQPWCVSRQLWWGHRIPAWYDAEGNVFVAESEAEVRNKVVEHEISRPIDPKAPLTPRAIYFADSEAGARAAMSAGIKSVRPDSNIDADVYAVWQDPDVLDTWFSSALWPFATLGWPEDETENPVRAEPVEAPSFLSSAAPEVQKSPSTGSGRAGSLVQRHYHNDLLISGFDILFFWDARMAMQGMKLMGAVPWKRLYLHGLVRAPDGQKMSKSKGNVVDPLLLIDQYGADALRFFMAAMESQGRDIKMDEKRVEGYRNFATKLWNAARFCQSNGIGASSSIAAPKATLAVNKWIIGEVTETLAALDKAMDELRFDAAANVIYHFVWDRFCDWYIELVKGNFDDETSEVAGWALDQILVMLHPFMPFVTEELWGKLGDRMNYPLITAKWPEPEVKVDAEAKAEVEWLIDLTSKLRGAKNEVGIAPGAKLEAWLAEPSAATRAIIETNVAAIDRLARLSAIHFEAPPSGAAMQIGAGDATVVIPLEGVIDIEAEKSRLAKARAASEKERDSLAKRLDNPKFVEKAKPEAVDKARADHAMHAAEAERLAAALERLG